MHFNDFISKMIKSGIVEIIWYFVRKAYYQIKRLLESYDEHFYNSSRLTLDLFCFN